MNIESNSKKRRRLEFEDKGDEIGTDGNSVEVEDTEPLLVVDEAISITLIASEIFRCLSHQDLLNCSLVNKTWNVSARFALREDRQSCVRIGRRGLQSQFPCEELTLFYNLISKSWSHPFNGFSFTFSSTNQGRRDSIDHICPSSTDKSELAISSVIEKLLSEINIKYLRICMTQKPTYICPVAIFMADMNPDLSKNLVGLLIDELPNLPGVRSHVPGVGWSSTVIRDFFTYFTSSANSSEIPMYFPNLKFLKLPDCTTLWGYTCPINRIFKQLLLASPKVTDLKGYIPLDLFQTVAQLPVPRNWVLQNLNLEIMSNSMLEILSMGEGNEDGVIVDVDQMLDLMLTFVDKQSIIKIQNLTVKADSIVEYSKTVRFFDFEESDFERIRNLRAKTVTVGIKLIESSCKYIRSLEINSTDLLPVIFKHYGESEESCLKLNQLSHLTIESTYMAEGALESLYNLSVYGFEFFCPYLKSVELVWNRPDDYNYDQMERFLPMPIPPDDDFIFPTNSCSPTVTKFAISVGYGFSDVDLKQMILKCGKLFPNVKSFVADMFHCTEDVELYIEALWTAWPNLESIQLKKLCSFTIQKNWDYLFTGLSRRDCTRFFRPWKIWTDEQFQKLQKAHSLLDFTKLKHLQFQTNHWKCEEGKRQRRPRLGRIFLSKLTGHFIFRRMPQLKVHILRTCCDSRATETNPVKCRFKLKHLRKYVQFDHGNEDD